MTEEFDKKLEKLRGKEDSDAAERARGASLGMRIASEMIAALLVGFLLGYYLDVYFDTSPLLLVIFILLGALAGGYGLYKLAMRDSGE